LGTVGYMAPEQVSEARSAGPPADLFALGAILHECATGAPLFEGDSVLEVIGKITSGSHERASAVRPDVPAWLEAAIERCVKPDPLDRFASCDDLVRALVERRAPRSRAPSLVGAAVVAVGAIAAGVFAMSAPPAPPAPPPPPKPAPPKP